MRSFVLPPLAIEEVHIPGLHHFVPMAGGFVMNYNMDFVKCNVVRFKMCVDALQRGAEREKKRGDKEKEE